MYRFGWFDQSLLRTNSVVKNLLLFMADWFFSSRHLIIMEFDIGVKTLDCTLNSLKRIIIFDITFPEATIMRSRCWKFFFSF